MTREKLAVTGSGSFMSNTGTSLNIIGNWYAGIDASGGLNVLRTWRPWVLETPSNAKKPDIPQGDAAFY